MRESEGRMEDLSDDEKAYWSHDPVLYALARRAALTGECLDRLVATQHPAFAEQGHAEDETNPQE